MTTPESPYAPAPIPAPTPAPAAPAAPRVSAGTDTRSLVLTLSVAVVMLIAAVVNIVGGSGFPGNAPVEQIWNFGITVDFVAVAIALVVRFVVIVNRPRFDAPPISSVGALALTGVILAGVTLAGWLVLGGIGFLGSLVTGEGLRYYMDTNGAFFLGAPWMAGLFFGVAGLRRGKGTPTTVAAIIAIAVPLLIVAFSLFSAVAYGLGLTD